MGGLTTYGSSTELTSSKVVYAAFLMVVVSLSIWRCFEAPASVLRARGSDVLGVWCGIVLICISVGTLASEADLAVAIRQGLFYFLAALAPFVGIELGRGLNPAKVMALTVALGTLTAVGFAVDWLDRRGVGTLHMERLLLGSPLLAALGFSLGLVLMIHGRGLLRLLALFSVVVIPAALLVTGTRTNLIIIFVIVALVGTPERYRISLRNAFLVLLSGVGVVAALVLLAPLVLQDARFLTVRLQALVSVLSGGASGDASLMLRYSQTVYAYEKFAEAPFFGQGFSWIPETVLDTPVAVLARIGLVGTFALVAYMVLWWRQLRLLEGQFGPNPFLTAARGLAMFFVTLIPFGSPFEDRGFALALMLLFAGVSSMQASGVADNPNPGKSSVSSCQKETLPGAARGRVMTPARHR